jgi:hypothetical protein
VLYPHISPHGIKAAIHDVFARYFVDENPQNIERPFQRVYSSGFAQRPDLKVMLAFWGSRLPAGIFWGSTEIELWAQLGGILNGQVHLYSYLYPLPHYNSKFFWYSPKISAEGALVLLERG